MKSGVGREVENPRADCLDGLAHPGDLMGGQVVEDDGVTGLEDRSQGVGDVGPEAQTITVAFRREWVPCSASTAGACLVGASVWLTHGV